MAHGRPASRHGRYEAFHKGLGGEATADELPSQSVFSYDGTEDVRRARDNPLIGRQMSARHRSGSRGVVASGPVVAVHMLDMHTDGYGNTSPTADSCSVRSHSRESTESYVPQPPHPPPSPRLSRAGSARRRSFREKRPPSSRRRSRDYTAETQEELLPPMATLRPQSSLGKYHVLPDIGAPADTARSRSSSVDDQRGTEEVEALVAQLAHKAGFSGIQTEPNNHSVRHSQPHSSPADGSQDTHKSQTRDMYSAASASGIAPGEASVTKRRPSTRESSANSSSAASAPSPGALDRSRTSLSHYKMDEAPLPTSDGQILLGIKIPTDGTRHKQYFNLRDQLRCIVLFAEEVSGEDFSNHVLVLANPRKKYSNLSQTIEEAGIETKSVIHLEELD